MTALWEAARLRHDLLYFVINLLPTRAALRAGTDAETAPRARRHCVLARAFARRGSGSFIKLACRRSRDAT